jgi:glyoxylate reductase
MMKGVTARVFVSRKLPGDAVERLQRTVEVDLWEEAMPPPPEVLHERASNADGLVVLLTERIDRQLLSSAKRLKVVSNVAVGVDNIDVAACTERNIPVGHTPGVLTETSADLAFALLMTCARRITEGERFVHQGRWKTWDPSLLLGQDVHGATLGIVGMGKIGFAVARTS